MPPPAVTYMCITMFIYCALLLIVAEKFVEPGYYEAGGFGVRLETIVMATYVDTKVPFGQSQIFPNYFQNGSSWWKKPLLNLVKNLVP